jgi:hypothetical protein
MNAETIATIRQDSLPNSIALRNERVIVWANGMKWLPTFCANCGKEGGMVMETDWERVKNFAFYLCDPCSEKWSPLVDTKLAPDEVFWQKVRAVQFDEFGRELSEPELIEALKDDNHILTKLCKDRYKAVTIVT